MEDLREFIARALCGIKPGGQHLMPNECMATHRHLIPFCKGDTAVCATEVIEITLWMDGFELHHVFDGQQVELASERLCILYCITPFEWVEGHGGANKEPACLSIGA
jgi:hypothetical protein